MWELRPATDPNQEATELWQRVTERAQSDQHPGDEPEWPARRRAVRDLCARLDGAPGVASLAATVAADEDDDRWRGAEFLAGQLGFEGALAHVVFWLIGLKSTSGEAKSKYFRALQAAACDTAEASPPELDGAASTIYEQHGDLLASWIAAQQDLTAELLTGIDEVTLHRGDTIHGELPAGPAHPGLMPLASFAVDYSMGAEFAGRAQGCRGGTGLVYGAIVPVRRILATPVTGGANPLEHEIVLLTGNSGDLATTTWI